jgi:hypothetical protein
MRIVTILVIILLSILISCKHQYFTPTNIKNRTKEFAGNNTWIALNDKEQIDGYTRIGNNIYGGEIACDVKPLKDIDINSFQVLPGTQYAKDKNHVYYPLETICEDYTDCGVCHYTDIIIRQANPATFRYLGKEYATDGNIVFFRGQLLQGADGASFKVIDGPEFFFFAVDKNKVYKHNDIFAAADPATFYFDKDNSNNVLTEFGSKYIITDKNKVWEYTPPDQIRELKSK